MTKTEKENNKLMRSAGFKPLHQSGFDTIVWGLGDIRVAVTGTQRMSVKRLVQYVIVQAAYRMRRSASMNFEGFKTDNVIGKTNGGL